jgi:hypothetical protein
MRTDPFAPISIKPLLGNWLKQFFLVWAIVLIPVVGSVALLVYQNLPLIGACAGYGALVSLIAFARHRTNSVEVTKDLQIKSTQTNPIHPDLLKYSLIINAIFAVEAIMLYIAIP